MENFTRIVNDSVDTLENILPEIADCADNDKERSHIRQTCNRLARLINQVREQLN